MESGMGGEQQRAAAVAAAGRGAHEMRSDETR